jgi:hypothetical protein
MTPASIRNHNPGAMYPGPSARKFGSAAGESLVSKDGKHQIARFPTAVHGAAALFDNLMNARTVRGYYYRNKPLAKAIETWCGSIRAQSYLRLIEQQTGYKPDLVLSEAFLRDPEQAIALAKAMARHEAGRDYPLSGNEWIEAHAMAFSGGHVAPEPSPNNDVPTMRPEARAAAVAANVKSVAVATGAGGVATTTVAAPPDLGLLAAWKAWAVQAQELVMWAGANLKWVLVAGAVYVLTTHVLPWVAEHKR